MRALVGDDEALEAGILPALQKYNVEQLIVADLPDKQQVRSPCRLKVPRVPGLPQCIRAISGTIS